MIIIIIFTQMANKKESFSVISHRAIIDLLLISSDDNKEGSDSENWMPFNIFSHDTTPSYPRHLKWNTPRVSFASGYLLLWKVMT